MKNQPDGERPENNPGTFYRSAPFWAWNDRLDPEELKRQVREMKEQGMGGFIIHSREGLETEYLSEEWMNCVGETLKEAEKQGMEAWIYDEDKWPSGSAGGLVSTAESGEFTARAVTAELLTREVYENRDGGDDPFLACYSLKLSPDETNRIEDFVPIAPFDSVPIPSGHGHILICREEISGPSEWYNNLAPPDNLNPKSIKCFLDMTHEKYGERFSEHFGNTVRGFFTDEPNFCDFFSHFTPGRPWLPWSSTLIDFFTERRGYSPLEILPLLFLGGDKAGKARYDYWLTLTERFQSAYMKQLYTWCDENHLELTGHVLYENDLGYSVRVSGAAMPHYRFMHAPGIDILGDSRQEYLTVKQCTSVANQFGRKTVFSETYGCTGWEFDFAGQKRVGDWQFVMGVNKRCQHLALYSLSGCRKRDYPPSFNYHNNWWPHDHIMEDYFARLSSCVTGGEVSRDILLIHPMGTYWMKSGSAMNEDLENRQMNMGWLDSHILDLNKKGDGLNHLTRDLLMAQLDFDFGDELIMRDEARVEGGKLIIGRQAYKTVVIPLVDTLMGSTAALLDDLILSGGTVYRVGPLPGLIDAKPGVFPSALQEKAAMVEDYADLLIRLRLNEKRALRISDDMGKEPDGFLSMVRKDGQRRVITVVNTEANGLRDTILHLNETGAVTNFDLLSGKMSSMKVILSEEEQSVSFRATFHPEETKVFLLNTNEQPEEETRPFPYRHPHYVTSVVQGFPSRTDYSCSLENTLTLDRCQFKLADGPWEEETLVWRGQKSVRERLEMLPVYYNGAPQRYSWLDRSASKQPVPLKLRFSFYVDASPEGPVYAAVEKSKDFTLTCNGQPCEITEETFLDRALNKHRLPVLRQGENILEIEMDYRESIELEDIYLTGIFAVSPDRHIGKLPDRLRLGDWTEQGLFHYGGNVTYRYILPPQPEAGDNLLLRIGKFSGTLALARINGSEGEPLLRGDEEIDVTGKLYGDKENLIEIEIVGNLRNLMGPFHKSFKTCSRISWKDFRTENQLHTDEYRVHPFGLFEPPAIVEKQDI